MTRDDVRAAILLVVVGVHGFAAAPLAHRAIRANLDLPVARDEFERLQALGDHLGLHYELDELADAAYAASLAERDFRTAGLAPFAELFRLTGTGQAWGLFTYPDRFPARVIVEGRGKGGEWRRLYASLDPDATFDRDTFVYRRIRGVYDNNSETPGATWDAFCTFAAREAFGAYPDVDEVRVSFQRIHTREPGESEAPIEEGERHGVRTRWRR